MNRTRSPLRILLGVQRRERAPTFECALAQAGHLVASTVGLEEDLGVAVRRIQPDALLLEVEAPTRQLLRSIRQLGEQPLPIAVFADRSSEEDIRAAIKAGVSSYVVDGLQPNRVIPVLEATVARFIEFQALRSERDVAVAKLGERRAIERAKGILMRRRDLPEDAAYVLLRKMAMNRGRRIIEVAESIITAEEALTQS